MKVKNMTSAKGNKAANQFTINCDDNKYQGEYLQSYDSIIAKRMICRDSKKVYILLDENTWDYSKTTGKYRNLFLGETKKETERKIAAGIYQLVNLNQ